MGASRADHSISRTEVATRPRWPRRGTPRETGKKDLTTTTRFVKSKSIALNTPRSAYVNARLGALSEIINPSLVIVHMFFL